MKQPRYSHRFVLVATALFCWPVRIVVFSNFSEAVRRLPYLGSVTPSESATRTTSTHPKKINEEHIRLLAA